MRPEDDVLEKLTRAWQGSAVNKHSTTTLRRCQIWKSRASRSGFSSTEPRLCISSQTCTGIAWAIHAYLTPKCFCMLCPMYSILSYVLHACKEDESNWRIRLLIWRQLEQHRMTDALCRQACPTQAPITRPTPTPTWQASQTFWRWQRYFPSNSWMHCSRQRILVSGFTACSDGVTELLHPCHDAFLS